MQKKSYKQDIINELIKAHRGKTCNVWYQGKLVVGNGKLLDEGWLNDAVERSLKWRGKHTTEGGRKVSEGVK